MTTRDIILSAACVLAIACFHDPGLTAGTDAGTTSTGTGTTAAADPTTSTTTTATTTAGTTAEPTTTGATTGPPPACTGTGTLILAVDALLLGDTDPDGTPDDDAWKQYGMDIDGLASTAESRGLCLPVAGAEPAGPYPDGDGGIDNSFGKNVLPLFVALGGQFSVELNDQLDAGKFTYLFSISGVDDDPACTTESALVLGADLGHVPVWDGTDLWPVDPSSLTDPTDPTAARCQFPKTTVIDGQVLAKPPDQFDLIFQAGDFPLIVPLHHARLTFDLAPDGQSASGGQISGILATEELVMKLQNIAAALDPTFCDPGNMTLESILFQVRQAADIMLDGTHDPGQFCDGISIGLGFTMKAVQLGPAADATPPPADPCAPP